MTIDANRDIVEAGITAIYQSGWRKGYQAGVKSFNEQTKLILPLMFSVLFIFSAGVLGAFFYAYAARHGWLPGIIGNCAP